jgi:hypothetical protein
LEPAHRQAENFCRPARILLSYFLTFKKAIAILFFQII